MNKTNLGRWFQTQSGFRVRIESFASWRGMQIVTLLFENGQTVKESPVMVDWTKPQEMSPLEVQHWRNVQDES